MTSVSLAFSYLLRKNDHSVKYLLNIVIMYLCYYLTILETLMSQNKSSNFHSIDTEEFTKREFLISIIIHHIILITDTQMS